MVEIRESDRFYRLLFAEGVDSASISLFERRFLTPDEYHPANLYLAFWITNIVAVEKRLKNDYTSFPVFYEDYERQRHGFYCVDNFPDLDGFRYNKNEGIVYYGDTSIYLVERDGKYYDIIQGEEILNSPNLRLKQILHHRDFEEMLLDLELIKEHKALYVSLLSSVFWKLWLAYEHYIHALSLLEREHKILEEEYQKNLYMNALRETKNERIQVKNLVFEIQNQK